MNTRSMMFRTPVAVALMSLIGFANANAAADSMTSVDARAPLQATLLPTVTVTASVAHPDGDASMRVAASDALPVTLMPTVRVTARAPTLAVTQLPTVRVYAAVEPASNAVAVAAVVSSERSAPAAAVARVALAEPAPMVRARVMPR